MNSLFKPLLLVMLAAGIFVFGAATDYFNRFPSRILQPLFEQVKIAAMDDVQRAYLDARIAGEKDPADTTNEYTIKGRAMEYKTPRFPKPLTVLPGVFNPREADKIVLPLMEANKELFAGKRVLEIGTGSGIISLYAAELGAVSVVSTDINPKALETLGINAERLGHDDIIDRRLVSTDNMAAFAVIEAGERFDILISNPPFALDLDAEQNDALTDRGDLGFSIVRGLTDHLNPDGKAILLYNSLFYHNVMVKFARYSGFEVRNHNPIGLYPWAAQTLYNSYLKRLLEVEGLPEDAFAFDRFKDSALDTEWQGNYGLKPSDIEYEGLLNPAWQFYSGFIVIEMPD
jgi:methylase of polypeptide subunit release factors